MKTLIVIMLSLSLFGCLPAAIAYTAYELSNSKERSAMTQAKAQETASYASYKTEMEKINLDREKSGLKKEPVLGLEDWKGTLN